MKHLSTAWISDDETRRYVLIRRWEFGKPLTVVMLNPSTADHRVNDPTIKKVIKFAKSHGYGSIVVGNLYSLRATDPDEISNHGSPIGPKNDGVLNQICRDSGVLCAWGAHREVLEREEYVVTQIIEPVAAKVMCLGVTKDGHPKHPLYIKDSKRFEEYRYVG